MHLASSNDGIQYGKQMRRKLEAMNLERWVANNLVIDEWKRSIERHAPDLAQVIACLHGKGLVATPLFVDIPAKEGSSAENAARFGRRDTALARRCSR